MKRTVISIIAIVAIITAGAFTFKAYGENPASGDHGIVKTESVQHEVNHESHESEGGHHAPHIDAKNLSLLWIIPFVGILLSIALFPLLIPHFWHHHYGKVSLFWWIVFFTAFSFHFGMSTGMFYLLEVYFLEFIPFITLLLALFTVAGGIQLKGDLAAHRKSIQ